MQGKALRGFQVHVDAGITPAYAGKSQTAGTPCSSVRDHPRMCGEKLWPTCPHAPNAGSPPRMRGKDRLSGKSGQPDRITPACAEKRPARPGYAYNRGDHPRMCGKKFLEVVQPIAQWGSPPRMRGKGLQGHQARCRRGITPAYAGKSDLTSGTQTLLQGSPPHMRGKGLVCLERDIRVGITPACAGKSVSWYVMTSSTWDHPRMCEEKSLNSIRKHYDLGSPPHVRGKVLLYWKNTFRV